MVPPKYAYFIFQLLFFIPWIIIWKKRKDLHPQMLIIGFLSAIGSVICAYFFWTMDWWHPLTITSTRVGVEDFILGFSNGGIGACFFDYWKNIKSKPVKTNFKGLIGSSIFIFLCFVLLLGLLFWGVNVSSFWATTITLLIFISLIDFSSNKYLNNSIFSAFAMLITVIPVYLSIYYFSPSTFPNTYFFEKLSGYTWLGIPIEEFVFYFLFGAMIGPMWDWLQNQKFQKESKRKQRIY